MQTQRCSSLWTLSSPISDDPREGRVECTETQVCLLVLDYCKVVFLLILSAAFEIRSIPQSSPVSENSLLLFLPQLKARLFVCLSVLGIFDIEILHKCYPLEPKNRHSSFLFVITGYRRTPNITFYFHRGNEEDNFDIDTNGENNGVIAYIKSKNRIKGPKIFFLEFRGDVVDSKTGDLASRFVHRMYVFVSRYDFQLASVLNTREGSWSRQQKACLNVNREVYLRL